LSEWLQFAEQHWIIGGVLTSLLWFLAGKQSLSNRQRGSEIFWQGIAVFIILVLCAWAAVEREWLGLALGLAVLCIEAFWMRRS
jgi:hypothetical protein